MQALSSVFACQLSFGKAVERFSRSPFDAQPRQPSVPACGQNASQDVDVGRWCAGGNVSLPGSSTYVTDIVADLWESRGHGLVSFIVMLIWAVQPDASAGASRTIPCANKTQTADVRGPASSLRINVSILSSLWSKNHEKGWSGCEMACI